MTDNSPSHTYIQQHYAIPEQAAQESRFKWLKNFVSRCVAHFMRGQNAFNANVVRTIDGLQQRCEQLEHEERASSRSLRELTAAVRNSLKLQDHLDSVIATIDRRLTASEQNLGELRNRDAHAQHMLDDARSRLSDMDKRQDDVVKSIKQINSVAVGLTHRQDDLVRNSDEMIAALNKQQDDLVQRADKMFSDLDMRQDDVARLARESFESIVKRQDDLVGIIQDVRRGSATATSRHDDLLNRLQDDFISLAKRKDDLVEVIRNLQRDTASVARRQDDMSASQGALLDNMRSVVAENHGVTKRQDDLVLSVQTLSTHMSSMVKDYSSVGDRVDKADQGFRDLHALFDRMTERNNLLRTALDDLLGLLAAEKKPSAKTATDIAAATDECRDILSDAAYASYEDAHRGSEASVRKRLSYYADRLKKRKTSPRHCVLDLGCGRGEFVELLTNNGIYARGVDRNKAAVQHAVSRGLSVEHADMFAELERQKDNSLAALSAFHVIEHLSFAQLLSFLRMSIAKLRPNGLLMLETPNALSLVVAASDFCKDPTHTRPVHPATLEHWLKEIGFSRIEVDFLHPFPNADLLTVPKAAQLRGVKRNFEKLNSLIFGYRDCAVIATKPR